MICKMCKKEYKDVRVLAQHMSVSHKNISAKNYTIKYFYGEKIPKCMCGCGTNAPYRCFGRFMMYVSGHNSFTNNPFKGKHHTKETIQKIVNSEGYKNKRPSSLKQNIFMRCENCNKKFKVIKSKIDYKKFCSRICYSEYVSKSIKNGTLYGKKYLLNVSNAGSKASFSGKPSSIEIKFRNALRSNNIKFEHQCEIKCENKIHVVDFYLPKNNLIIQIDGDYWHCNPKKYDSKYYNTRVKKFAGEIWKKDNDQVDVLKSSGYNVKRIWECDINKTKNLVDLI